MTLATLIFQGAFLWVAASLPPLLWAVWVLRRLDDGCEDVKGGCEEWERWRRAYGEVVRRG